MIRFLTFLCLLKTAEVFILDGSTPVPIKTGTDSTTLTDNCTDTGEVNCETSDVYLDLCRDIHHAKVVCRLYCKLCDLVDGNWADWSAWSSCDVTCGTGNTNRTRTCTNPAPAGLGLNCTGPYSESKSCSLESCPVHGGWTGWSPWGGCSVSCGVGIQRRDRTCTNPPPQYFGDHCFGGNDEDQLCFPGNCTVHAGWGAWGAWGTCSTVCGVGMQRRERTCSNPAPSYFGDHCFGDGQQDQLCYSSHCTVHGGWSTWASWGSCSVTCGAGIQRRDRTCTNPSPQYIGDQCFGDSHDNRLCFPSRCADGGWSVWSSWGSCSRTCGDRGIRTRERYCNNPTPSMLGTYCRGPSTQSDTCGTAPVYKVIYDGNNCCVEYSAGAFILGYKTRLCSGNSGHTCHPKKGRVEIYIDSKWGTVCDDVWDSNNNAANVLCRSIGYCSGRNIPRIAGPTSSPIHFDDVNCTGRESNIYNCHHNDQHNCQHMEDATVFCE